MTAMHNSTPLRALLGGAICLTILGGMIVGHAWPLWTGETVLLRVRPVDPRDLFRGEFVRLDLPATQLFVSTGNETPPSGTRPVRPLGEWRTYAASGDIRKAARPGEVVYVQLEPVANSAEHQVVSISDAPVDDAINLRGRIRWTNASHAVTVDYGLDAYYMQEGTARPVEDALRAGRLVQLQVAVGSSGRARIRGLLVDGVPVR